MFRWENAVFVVKNTGAILSYAMAKPLLRIISRDDKTVIDQYQCKANQTLRGHLFSEPLA